MLMITVQKKLWLERSVANGYHNGRGIWGSLVAMSRYSTAVGEVPCSIAVNVVLKLLWTGTRNLFGLRLQVGCTDAKGSESSTMYQTAPHHFWTAQNLVLVFCSSPVTTHNAATCFRYCRWSWVRAYDIWISFVPCVTDPIKRSHLEYLIALSRRNFL